MQYVAFLRGINVGIHARMKMDDLRDVFSKMGFANVKTILATGNVVFESEIDDEIELNMKIESELKKSFKKDISVVLMRLNHLKKLQSNEPFDGVNFSSNTRLYVTFLPKTTKQHTIKIPYTSPQEDFNIIDATSSEVFSVLDLSKGKGTPNAMKILEKEFGPNITTRSWNTVLKILK